MIELFDSHRVKGDVFTPGRIWELYPEAVRAAASLAYMTDQSVWLDAENVEQTPVYKLPCFAQTPVIDREKEEVPFPTGCGQNEGASATPKVGA